MNRQTFLAAAFVAAAAPATASPLPPVTIYRDTGCTCCEGWAEAVQNAGYHIDMRDLDHDRRLQRFRVSPSVAGCHTAIVGGYLVEGHVPLAAVAKLLRERPNIRGIATPGMPSGTPGMPGPKVPVQVVAIDDRRRLYYAE